MGDHLERFTDDIVYVRIRIKRKYLGEKTYTPWLYVAKSKTPNMFQVVIACEDGTKHRSPDLEVLDAYNMVIRIHEGVKDDLAKQCESGGS